MSGRSNIYSKNQHTKSNRHHIATKSTKGDFLVIMVECKEIQLESDTPENIRARSDRKDDVHMSPTQTDNQTESTMQAASQQRAMSTRYVLDRPPQANTPDASFIRNFDSAVKLLKEISPIKKSMTFQREKENTSTSSVNQTPSSSITPNQETTSTGDKSIKKM